LWEEGEAARERVLEFYYQEASKADDRLRWLPGTAEPERFGDRSHAFAWFDGERAGLVAAVQWAWEERFAGTAVRLSQCLAAYLGWRRFFDDWITVAGTAREVARRVGNRLDEAIAWCDLGIALGKAGRVGEAIDAYIRALDHFQAAGESHYEAFVWGHLGFALSGEGRAGEAIDAHTRARALYQAAGNRRGEAIAWNNLGIALTQAGRAGEGVDAQIRARDLYQAVGDRHGEAAAWHNLGAVLRQACREDEAIDAYNKALAIFQEFKDWYGVGMALRNLARAREDAGHLAEARTHYLESADAFTRANAPTEAAQARTRAEALTP